MKSVKLDTTTDLCSIYLFRNVTNSSEIKSKLMNGEIWQQSSYDYMYEYSYSPAVIIFESTDGYMLKVEDVEETILVEQLK